MNFKNIFFVFIFGLLIAMATPAKADDFGWELCQDTTNKSNLMCHSLGGTSAGSFWDCSKSKKYSTQDACYIDLEIQKAANVKAAAPTAEQIKAMQAAAQKQQEADALQAEMEAANKAQNEAVKNAMAIEALKAAGMVCDCSKNGGQCKDDFTLVQDAIDYCMSCGLPPPKEQVSAQGCPIGSKEIGPFFCSCGSGEKAVCSPYDTYKELDEKCAKTCGRGNGPCPANVAGSLKKLQQEAKGLNKAEFGFGTAGILQIIGKMISFLMFPIGMFTMALYIWAGFLWMTASGNSENVSKAQSILVWTTLGVVVTMASYLIVKMVFTEIL